MPIYKIGGLDGLRGMAAVLVLLAHMSGWNFPIFPKADFSGTGRSGVLLFFVLSSFLLASQILKWNVSDVTPSQFWKKYLAARILRIWPLYIVVLLTALLTTHLGQIPILWRIAPFFENLPVPMSFDAVFKHLMLQRGEDILWTVPIEFKFYLLLPLIMLVILIPLRDYPRGTTLILIGLISLSHWLAPTNKEGVALLPFIGVFLTGILVAVLYSISHAWTGGLRLHSHVYELMAWLCLLAFVCLIPSVYLWMWKKALTISENEAQPLYSTLWGLLIFSMLRGSGLMRKVFELRLIAFVGTVSFSLYLWHRVPIHLMHRLTYFHKIDFLPVESKGAVILFTSVGIAFMSYRLVERPLQRWRTRRRRVGPAG